MDNFSKLPVTWCDTARLSLGAGLNQFGTGQSGSLTRDRNLRLLPFIQS